MASAAAWRFRVVDTQYIALWKEKTLQLVVALRLCAPGAAVLWGSRVCPERKEGVGCQN